MLNILNEKLCIFFSIYNKHYTQMWKKRKKKNRIGRYVFVQRIDQMIFYWFC